MGSEAGFGGWADLAAQRRDEDERLVQQYAQGQGRGRNLRPVRDFVHKVRRDLGPKAVICSVETKQNGQEILVGYYFPQPDVPAQRPAQAPNSAAAPAAVPTANMTAAQTAVPAADLAAWRPAVPTGNLAAARPAVPLRDMTPARPAVPLRTMAPARPAVPARNLAAAQPDAAGDAVTSDASAGPDAGAGALLGPAASLSIPSTRRRTEPGQHAVIPPPAAGSATSADAAAPASTSRTG